MQFREGQCLCKVGLTFCPIRRLTRRYFNHDRAVEVSPSQILEHLTAGLIPAHRNQMLVLCAAGSVSEVRDQFVAQWKHLPAEYVILIYHYAQQPKESVIANLKLFMDEVKPALDEMTDYPEA